MIRNLFNHHASQYLPYKNNILKRTRSNLTWLTLGSLDVPYQSGMTLGKGINLLNFQKPSSALIASDERVRHGYGQRQQLTATIIKNLDDLYKKLDISAQLAGTFSSFSANLSYTNSYESQFNSQSTFVHINQVISNPFEEAANFTLTPDAKDILDEAYLLQRDGNLEKSFELLKDFRDAYGDMYVRGFHAGGHLSAIISVESEDKSERENTAISLSAKFNMFKVDVSVDQLVKSVSKKVKINVSIDQQGGSGSEQGINLQGDNTQIFTQLLQRVKNLPRIVNDAPIDLACQLATYNSVYPELNFIDISKQLKALEEFETIRRQYVEQMNTVKYISEHKNFYSFLPSDKTLKLWQDFFKQKTDELEKHKKRCMNKLEFPTTEIKYEQPVDYIIPPMDTEASDPRESELLGSVWHVTEELDLASGRRVWKRRSNTSRIFDVEWRGYSGSPMANNGVLYSVKATQIITIKDNVVNVNRYNITATDKNGNPVAGLVMPDACKFTGVVNANGVIEGRTYSCDGGKQIEWSVFSIDKYDPDDTTGITAVAPSLQRNTGMFWVNKLPVEQPAKKNSSSILPNSVANSSNNLKL